MPSAEPDQQRPAFDWRAALAEHERWLRMVVLARVGEAEAVADVMQEVALAAGRGAEKLRDPGRAAPWFYRLAVTAALQHRRRAGRRRKLVDRYRERMPAGELEPIANDPLDWLLAEEQRELVRQALVSLPPRDAEMLLLKYTQDWSYAQLAEKLGVSQSAVEGRLHRARQKLRAALCRADPSLVEVR